MEISLAVVVIFTIGFLFAFANGVGAAFKFFLLYIAAAAILSWILSAVARRQHDILVNSDPESVAIAVRKSFSGVGWKQVEGPGTFNFRARGLGMGAYRLKRPIVSVQIEDLADGTSGVSIWTSAWSSRMGMMALCDRVVSKRFWLTRQLAELSRGGGISPAGLASPTSRSSPLAVPTSSDERLILVDPGLPEGHPRQLAHQLVTSVGLSFLVYGPSDAASCFAALSEVCPVLRASEGFQGSEFVATFTDHPGIFWFGFADQARSAIAICVGPEADSDFVAEELAVPLRNLRTPWRWGIGTVGGTVPAGFARTVEAAEIVYLDRFMGTRPVDTAFPADASKGRGPSPAFPKAGSQPDVITPPDIDRFGFIYTESRRYEDQSLIGTGQPPPSMWSIPQRVGVLGSSGRPILPWDARNVTAAAIDPSGHAIAFLLQGVDPLRIQTGDGLDVAVSSMSAFRIMQNRGFSICGISWSPNGSQLACLEWNGVGTLTLLDRDTGTRTFLTTLQGVVGSEVPVFSPDGRWILVSTSSAPQLISLEDRSVVKLPLKSAYVDWWPSKGPSALFALTGVSGEQRCGLYDLATATLNDLGHVILPVQEDLPKDRQLIFQPRMSPDGTRVLVGAFFGPDGRYQEEFGSRSRIAVLEVSTQIVRMQTEPFVDPERWLERVHEQWSWVDNPGTADATSESTEVCEELRSTARPFEKVDPAKGEPADERVVVWSWMDAVSMTPDSGNNLTVSPIAALSKPLLVEDGTPVPPIGRNAINARTTGHASGWAYPDDCMTKVSSAPQGLSGFLFSKLSQPMRWFIMACAGTLIAVSAWLVGNSMSTPDSIAPDNRSADAQQDGFQSLQGATSDPELLAPNVDSEAVSLAQLRRIAASDRTSVERLLADLWVPQISSKRPGIVDDGVVWDNSRTLREFLDNREKYGAKLLWSGDWSTFSAPDFWVTVVPVPFADSGGALQWCTTNGFDSWHCLAKLVSLTHSVAGSTALNRG